MAWLYQILTSAGVTTVLYFLFHTVIEARIAHEYKKREELFKAALQGQMEGVKAGYTKVLDENRIRFSQLHADQASALKNLYQYLVDTHIVLLRLTAQVKPGGRDEVSKDDQEDLKQFSKKYNCALETFTRNRLYLRPETCVKVEEFLSNAHKACSRFRISEELRQPLVIQPMQEFKEKARASVKDLEQALQLIEDDFRKILGVT